MPAEDPTNEGVFRSAGDSRSELAGDYSVRPATLDDAAYLAACRVNMARELDGDSDDTSDAAREDFARWIAGRIAVDSIVGQVAWLGDERVGGVLGITHELIPMMSAPDGIVGRVVGLFVEPGHRRRGVARALVTATLASLQAKGIRTVRLGASDAGRGLYESLGFEPLPEMGIMLSGGEGR